MKTKEIISDRMVDNIEILYNKFIDVINDFTEIDNIGDYEKICTVIRAIQLVHASMITVVAEDKETAQQFIQAMCINKTKSISTMSNWIKIERDSSGFATEQCLDKLIELHDQGYPIVVIEHGKDGYKYNIIFPEDLIDDWVSEIERDTDFTEFIKIPPFD